MSRERAVSAGVWTLALAGAVLRGALAVAQYPVTGDPVFSYVYRAVLLAHGEWRGLSLLWHPPGYPLLLAALTRLGMPWFRPYAVGVAVSLVSSVLLVLIVDRLVRSRVELPATRLVVASFVALYEGLFILAPAPLTEPPFLVLVYGAVLVLDRAGRSGGAGGAGRAGRPQRRWTGPLLAGLLLGLAATLRFEGVGAILGLALLTALWTGGETRRSRLAAAALLLGGAFLAAGWLLADPRYLARAAAAQRPSYTIPAASTLLGQARRAVEATYHALVVWLPETLLLPYWCLAALGLAARWERGRARLHGLLLAVVLPILGLVTLTVMHKRTGAFLLPAAGIWVGLGVEALALRLAATRRPGAARWLVGLAIVVNVLQVARAPVDLARHPTPSDPVTRVAAQLLSRALEGSPGRRVKAWAFGAEPEVYGFSGVPTVYPFFEREEGYNDAYRLHRGDPSGFVAALRSRGFEYLTFCLCPPPSSAAPAATVAHQPYGDFSGQPSRRDLEALVRHAADLGLAPRGRAPADGGRCRVYLMAVMAVGPAGAHHP